MALSQGALILLQFAAILQLTDSILYFDILLNFSLCYVMRLRYIVLFRYFRLGYQFYVVILRDISTHHALK